VTGDAFGWLRTNATRYDAVIVDLPDPDETATAKLYSVEFYALAARALTPGGRMVVQAGSPYFAPLSFWCIDASVRAAGFATTPYHVDVPSFGDWGFVLAAAGTEPPRPQLDTPAALRSLDADSLAAATVFPVDRRRVPVAPTTLMKPSILEHARSERRGY